MLFVNDQVYNAAFQLKEEIRETPYYRHETKKHVNDLFKFMDRYNRQICGVAKVNVQALAIITQSLEDDIQPHIYRYRMAISRTLHNSGVHGDLNSLISLSSTIDMLCQASAITISDFFTAISKYAPLACNPLEWLSVGKAMYLVRRITDLLVPEEVYINLNEVPAIATAFQAIANKLLSPEVFEKAFNEAETIN